jgi:hypothetical protein
LPAVPTPTKITLNGDFMQTITVMSSKQKLPKVEMGCYRQWTRSLNENMMHIDKRQKMALDEAYRLYRQIIRGEKQPDIYQLANSLTTLNTVLTNNGSEQFKLTKRLWQRTFESLCDLLITSFPVHVIIYNPDGEIQTAFEPIIEPATIEIHALGLRRKTDIFSLNLNQLNPLTKNRIEQIWLSRGPMLKPEDFKNLECSEFCVPNNFLIGDEVLRNESEFGKERAYKKWWELYWQVYCAPYPMDKQVVQQEMHTLEAVWGNLYY